MGYPYLPGSSSESGLNQRVYYCFPESRDLADRKKWEERLKAKKQELATNLLERLSEYKACFEISGWSNYPHPQIVDKGVVLCKGRDGSWIEVKSMIGGSFLAFQNLDRFAEAIAGFNIGSDTLEYLDESLLCPILYTNRRFPY